MIVPLALPNGGRFQNAPSRAKEYSRLQLETANMRVDRIRRFEPSAGWKTP
jgi:hypothetical protein